MGEKFEANFKVTPAAEYGKVLVDLEVQEINLRVTKVVSVRDLNKIRHELICWVLLGTEMWTSDQKLSSIGLSSRLSPDCIIGNQIIEIGTQYFQTELYYTQKKLKYSLELKRLLSDMAVGVSIIGRDEYSSDYSFTTEEREILGKTFATGVYLQTCLSGLGYFVDLNTKENLNQLRSVLEKIKEMFLSKSFHYQELKELNIDDELIKIWRTTPTPDFYTMFHDQVTRKTAKLKDDYIRHQSESVEQKLQRFEVWKDKHLLHEWMDGNDVVELRESFKTAIKYFPGVIKDPDLCGHVPEPSTEPDNSFYLTDLWRQCLETKWTNIKDDSVSPSELFNLELTGFSTGSAYYHSEKRGNLGYFGKTEDDIGVIAEDQDQSQILKKNEKERGLKYKVMLDTSKCRMQLAKRGVWSKSFVDKSLTKQWHKLDKVPLKWETDTSVIDHGMDFPWFKEDNSLWIDSRDQEVLDHHVHSLDHDSKESYLKLSKTPIFSMAKLNDLIFEEVTASMHGKVQVNQVLFKKVRGIPVFLILRPITVDKGINFSVMIPRSWALDTPEGLFIRWHSYDRNYVISDFFTYDKHRLSHLNYATELLKPTYQYLLEIFQGNLEVAQSHMVAQFFISSDSKAALATTGLLSRFLYMESTSVGPVPRKYDKFLYKFPQFFRDPMTLWAAQRMYKASVMMCLKEPFVREAENKRKKSVELGSEDKVKSTYAEFNNLISWFTLKPIDDYEQALYLSYSTCFHNSDEGNQNQAAFWIFQKVIKLELTMYNKTWDYFSRRSEEEKYSHGFRVDMVYEMGKAKGRFLKKLKGEFYGQDLIQRIAEKVSSVRWEEFATLKASSVAHDEWDMRESSTSRKLGKRVRCAENVLSILCGQPAGSDFVGFESILQAAKACDVEFPVTEKVLKAMEGDHRDIERELSQDMLSTKLQEQVVRHFAANKPLACLAELMQVVCKKGVFANLFKKPQLNGIREIFVLDMYSRIVIYFMEMISRLICDDLPMEALTKGTQKVTKIQDYYKSLNMIQRNKMFSDVITASCSDDKTNWCQQFVQTAFGCQYMGFFDEIKTRDTEDMFELIGKAIFSVMNMVSMKRLELPANILKSFYDKQGVFDISFDKGMNRLKEEYLGKQADGETKLLRPFSCFLQNRSNFMQGICHYTSSDFHCAYVIFISGLVRRYCVDVCAALNELNGNSEVCRYYSEFWEVSSDDSLFLMSIFCNAEFCNEEWKNRLKMTLMLVISSCMIVVREWQEWACMKTSEEKSTGPCFSGVCEFNSFWMVYGSLMIPAIKFIYGSLKPKVSQMLEDRVRMTFELRKQFLENCGKVSTCYWICMSQCLIHYRALGLTVSKWWPYYWKLNTVLKSPNLGYFLMDKERTSGAMSYNCRLFDLINNDLGAASTFKWLYFNEGKLEVDERGDTTVRIALYIGSREKYLKTLKRLLPPLEYEEILRVRPEFCFRKAENSLESLYEIWKKIQNPSSANAFSFLGAYKMTMTSIYILDSACVQNRKKINGMWYRKWNSLLGVMIEAYSKIGGFSNYKMPKNPSLSHVIYEPTSLIGLVFKDMISYQGALDAEKTVYNYQEIILSRKMRQRKQVIRVPTIGIGVSVSLRDVLKRVWFPSSLVTRHSDTEQEFALKYYCRVYPWLLSDSNTLHTFESLLESDNFPFSGVANFRDFLNSSELRETVIFPVSAAKPAGSYSDIMLNLFCYTWSSWRIFKKYTTEKAPVKNEVYDVYRTLSTWTLLPSGFLSFPSLPDSLVQDLPNEWQWTEDIRTQTVVNAKISFLCGLLKKEKSPLLSDVGVSMLREFLRNTSSSTYISYEQSQEKINGKWVGFGKINVMIDNDIFKLHVFDDKCMLIQCKDMVASVKHFHSIKKVCRRLKLFSGSGHVSKQNLYLDLHLNSLRGVRRSDWTIPIEFDSTLVGVQEEGNQKFYINLVYSRRIEILSKVRSNTIKVFSCPLITRPLEDVVGICKERERKYIQNKITHLLRKRDFPELSGITYITRDIVEPYLHTLDMKRREQKERKERRECESAKFKEMMQEMDFLKLQLGSYERERTPNGKWKYKNEDWESDELQELLERKRNLHLQMDLTKIKQQKIREEIVLGRFQKTLAWQTHKIQITNLCTKAFLTSAVCSVYLTDTEMSSRYEARVLSVFSLCQAMKTGRLKEINRHLHFWENMRFDYDDLVVERGVEDLSMSSQSNFQSQYHSLVEGLFNFRSDMLRDEFTDESEMMDNFGFELSLEDLKQEMQKVSSMTSSDFAMYSKDVVSDGYSKERLDLISKARLKVQIMESEDDFMRDMEEGSKVNLASALSMTEEESSELTKILDILRAVKITEYSPDYGITDCLKTLEFKFSKKDSTRKKVAKTLLLVSVDFASEYLPDDLTLMRNLQWFFSEYEKKEYDSDEDFEDEDITFLESDVI